MIRIVWGTGTAPTPLAAYDTALEAAGVHNFNLRSVSSVIPPETPVVSVGTASDLGTPGEALTVVEARATATTPATVAAGLGWRLSDSGGIIYEADGRSETAVTAALDRGLEHGQSLRGWSFDDGDQHVVSASVGTGAETDTASDSDTGDGSQPETNSATTTSVAAVVLAVFGEAVPIRGLETSG